MTRGHWQGRFRSRGRFRRSDQGARRGIISPESTITALMSTSVHAEAGIQSEEDLNGKVIGVETGTASEDFINRRLEIDAPGFATG